MEKVNAYTFYEMARELARVQALADDVSTAEALIPIMNARTRMKTLVNGDPVPLGVCRATAIAVVGTLDTLWGTYNVDDGNGGQKFEWPTADQKFAAWQLNWFRNALEKFETVFSAEMAEVATYFVPRRGIFYTPALVDTADEAFPGELLEFIPEKTKLEWRSAGRCLAFNLLSASGFHVARAVEGTMEVYYRKFVGDSDKLKNWGEYVSALEKAAKEPDGPAEKTVSEIVQMKDDYRNPLMHPRVVLSEPDARMLFANGESLIIAMAGEIKKVLEKPALTVVGGANEAAG